MSNITIKFNNQPHLTLLYKRTNLLFLMLITTYLLEQHKCKPTINQIWVYTYYKTQMWLLSFKQVNNKLNKQLN